MSFGPANLLRIETTAHCASMAGSPYDDPDSWLSIYPPEVIVHRLQRCGVSRVRKGLHLSAPALNDEHNDTGVPIAP
jgi:hypothetical protein